MKSNTSTVISRIVYLTFMIIHSFICCFTSYFGDDYYYAGFVREGNGYFLSENVVHYKETNGRIFVHLLDELLIGFGPWPWRIFCIACIGTLIILLAKIASRSYRADVKDRTEDFNYALIAVCALFSVIELPVLVQSVYWMTGSLNYIFPITCTVFVYYLFRRDAERGSKAKSYLLIIPSFVAGLTTEQASICAVLAIACIILYQLFCQRKIPHPSYFISFAASLIAAATLFFAPGNQVRTEYYPEFYALSLIGKIQYNARYLLLTVAGDQGIHVLISIALVTLTVLLIKNAFLLSDKKGMSDKKLSARFFLYVVVTAVCAVILMIYLTAVNEYASSDADIATLPLAPILILILPIGGVLTASLLRFFTRGATDDLFFLWCAAAMQISMSVSPQFGPRTVMISAIFLIVPVARRMLSLRSSVFGMLLYASVAAIVLLSTLHVIAGAIIATVLSILIYRLIKVINQRERQLTGIKNVLLRITATYALVVCLLNLFSISYGFYKNYPVHRANEAQIKNYNKEGPLVLYYLKYNEYGYTMPYNDPYHEIMLLRLIGLPDETKIIYTEYNEE